MKNMILTGLILGVIFSQVTVSSSSPPVEYTQKMTLHTVEQTVPLETDKQTISMQTEEQPESLQSVKQEISLQMVNNISLDDDAKIVLDKMGEPQQISSDTLYEQSKIYKYPDMNIAFNDGFIEYVEVLGSASTILLDKSVVPATIEAVKGVLGEPDFIAEDGIVFQRNESLLKLFIDPDTGGLISITFYHLSSV